MSVERMFLEGELNRQERASERSGMPGLCSTHRQLPHHRQHPWRWKITDCGV